MNINKPLRLYKMENRFERVKERYLLNTLATEDPQLKESFAVFGLFLETIHSSPDQLHAPRPQKYLNILLESGTNPHINKHAIFRVVSRNYQEAEELTSLLSDQLERILKHYPVSKELDLAFTKAILQSF
jgi:hypothetical protein